MSPDDDTLERPASSAVARIDRVALEQWMRSHVDGFEGPIEIEKFPGGQSNPTFKLQTPARSFVLRSKPPGKILKGAHAVEREARVMEALKPANFPVPQVFGLCTDERVLGSWFYVMELVEGRIFWDATFPNVSHDDRPAYFDAMNDTLARLHILDHRALGLEDFGRPGNYLARQIDLWSRQYRDDVQAGRNEDMDRLIEWLPQNLPARDETGVVHGDFRCDNVIFHPTEPRIIAVLDWELSTLGDPVTDFAYHCLMYYMPPRIVAGLADADLRALNIPPLEEFVAAYCARTGRSAIESWDYYIAFNFFRLAAIFHGIQGRVLRGNAASAEARERAANFPILAALARQAMTRCEGASGSL